MRIVIGQITHETNTMFGVPTSVDEFRRQDWALGQDVIKLHDGVRDYLGGMIDAARKNDIEVVPTFSANAVPSGVIMRSAFDQMLGHLLTGIKNAGEIDAICLALHGAGSAEGIDDIEGAILKAVRELVGPELPVIVTLDLHCHMTTEMVEQSTALMIVHEYPHIDCYECGFSAIELAYRTVRREVSPVMRMISLPMFIPPTTTYSGPAYEIKQRCKHWEDKGLLHVSFGHGFPHTDVPVIASNVMAIADGDAKLAEEAAMDVANQVWNSREEFRPRYPDPATALTKAKEAAHGPVVIAEVSDNTGGGAPGCGTHLLKAMLEADLPNSAFGFIYDPVASDQAHAAGPGATISIEIGGQIDPDCLGAPIQVEAYVKSVTDGRFIVQSEMGGGKQIDLGKMARLVIGNVDIIIGSERYQTIDPELFLLHGIDVTRYKIIALKSQNHFLSGFGTLAAEVIRTDPPGWTPSDLSHLDYQRISRPIWPLDDNVKWDQKS